MNFLASFLSSIFTSLLSYFSTRFAKSVAATLLMVTIVTSLAAGLYTFLRSLTSGIAASITNEWVLMGMGMIWPSNAEACITAILSAELAVYIYQFKKDIYVAAVPKT